MSCKLKHLPSGAGLYGKFLQHENYWSLRGNRALNACYFAKCSISNCFDIIMPTVVLESIRSHPSCAGALCLPLGFFSSLLTPHIFFLTVFSFPSLLWPSAILCVSSPPSPPLHKAVRHSLFQASWMCRRIHRQMKGVLWGCLQSLCRNECPRLALSSHFRLLGKAVEFDWLVATDSTAVSRINNY